MVRPHSYISHCFHLPFSLPSANDSCSYMMTSTDMDTLAKNENYSDQDSLL